MFLGIMLFRMGFFTERVAQPVHLDFSITFQRNLDKIVLLWAV